MWESIVLGVLQGLTEFLPVSSSGHLVIAGHILGFQSPGIVFEVFVHLGTLLAVVTYYWKRIGRLLAGTARFLAGIRGDIERSEAKYLAYLVIASIPAALVGLLSRRPIERAFASPILTFVMLLVTGALLWISFYHRENRAPSFGNTLLAGMGQALAIMPGISRSGATIVFGMLGKMGRVAAVEFAFLLSIPAILGATILQASNVKALSWPDLVNVLAGASSAYLFGYLAISLMLRAVRSWGLRPFAYYCWVVGAVGLAASFLI
jgi:undecaprenyl-diphosphatase